jgi:multidrug resistance efflux pump
MKRYVVPILAAASLAFAIIWTIHARPIRTETLPPAAPPEGPYASSVAAEGLVEPESENVALSPAVPGLVTRIYVKTGDHVRAGDRLFSLDDRGLAADLGVKRALLDAARARLSKLLQAPRKEEVPPLEAKVAEARALLADAEVQVRLIEGVSDRRAVRLEDVERRRLNFQAAKARLALAERDLALLKAGAWSADLAIARADREQATAAVRQDEINIERLTIRAPVDGVILQSKVRLGQYAQIGHLAEPLMVFGAGKSLHVRVDINESDIWRIRAGNSAVARLRGNSKISYPLEFVRIEPYVVPKRSLTGEVTERVDTRVLQVIYRFRGSSSSVFDGQQMDVYINTPFRAHAQTMAQDVRSRGAQ